MAEPLFFVESLPGPGATATLAGDEAHHAIAARRLKVGDTLWLFDGRGTLARTALVEIAARRRGLALRVEERRTEPPAKPSIHLACALPKGDRQAVLLDMATQLGMASFTPLVCERGVVKSGENAGARWRRICLEACKQSRRLYLPEILPPATPAELAARAAAEGAQVWIAHPSGEPVSLAAASKPTQDIVLLIGPEGGFTEEEIREVLAQGARPVSLGSAILRIETAAVALLAALTVRA